MGATLDKVINAYISRHMEQSKTDQSKENEVYGEAKVALYETLVQKVKTEIFDELTEEEIRRQKKRIDEEAEGYATQKGIREIRTFIVEGVGLAIIIGLIVNQFTDILTYIKGAENYKATAWIILGLVIIVSFYVFCRFAGLVNNLIKRKDG